MPRTATVLPSGGFDDLSAVLRSAQPGDTVRLTAGTYQASWPIPSGVRVLGEGPDHTVVMTDDSAFKLAHATAVEDLRIVARRQEYQSIHLEPGARGVRIANCVFEGVATVSIGVEGAEAIVEDCTFAGGTGHGIVATDATLTIRGTRFQTHPHEPLVARRSRVEISRSAFDTEPGGFQLFIDGGHVTIVESDFACGDIQTIAARADAQLRIQGCSFQWYRRNDNAIWPLAVGVEDHVLVEVQDSTFGAAEQGATERSLGVSLRGDARGTVERCRFDDIGTASVSSGRGLLTLRKNEFVAARTSVRVLEQGRLLMEVTDLADPALTTACLAAGVQPEQTRIVAEDGSVRGHLHSNDPQRPATFVPLVGSGPEPTA